MCFAYNNKKLKLRTKRKFKKNILHITFLMVKTNNLEYLTGFCDYGAARLA